MATIETVMLFLCLLCGALGQHDVNEMTIGEISSFLSEQKDKTLGDFVPEAIAESIREQASNWQYTDEVQPSLGNDLDLNDDLNDVINLELADNELVEASLGNDLDLTDAFDDVKNLDLADNELVGGCKGGACHFCAKIFKYKACLDAKLLKLGFELKVTLGGHVIFDKQVTAKNIPPLCKSILHIGKACVQVYDVDIAKKSACVRVTLTVKIGKLHKTFKIKLACFHLKLADEAAPLPLIQLMKALVAKRQSDRNI